MDKNRQSSQRQFVARGLASRNEAKTTGQYYAAYEVLDSLDQKLRLAKSRSRSAGKLKHSP